MRSIARRSCASQLLRRSPTFVTTASNARCSIKQARGLGPGTRVSLAGWIKTVRKHKTVAFVDFNDGSCLGNMQIALNLDGNGDAHARAIDRDQETPLKIALEQLTVGSSIAVVGVLQASQGQAHALELTPERLDVVGSCDAKAYPLQKKYQTLEFLRGHLHLRARTNTFGAVTRVRNALSQGLHRYFQDHEFLQLHSPILTSNDCEGAGEQFSVITTENGAGKEQFFGTPVYLTVSGQLHAEMYACAMGSIYTFGPTFRAENSNTTRHLSEFWMVEAEMAFAGLPTCLSSAQSAVQHAIRYAQEHCQEDIAFFEKLYDKQLSKRLQQTTESDFVRMTYSEAIQVLQASKEVKKFQVQPKWGLDLQTEHERFLAEKYVGGPVFITDYPTATKAFYMRRNSVEDSVEQKRDTVAAMDLLVPSIGEIVGGSVREERLDVLESRMRQLGLLNDQDQANDLDWYLDLRRFGSVPHAGWGLGFERLVQYVTGMSNIRDVIPVPRFPGGCKH